jgi:hypothetical protein
MVHSGYEASAVDDTFGSMKGFYRAVKATLFGGTYANAEALAALERSEDLPPVEKVPLTLRGKTMEEPQEETAQIR